MWWSVTLLVAGVQFTNAITLDSDLKSTGFFSPDNETVIKKYVGGGKDHFSSVLDIGSIRTLFEKHGEYQAACNLALTTYVDKFGFGTGTIDGPCYQAVVYSDEFPEGAYQQQHTEGDIIFDDKGVFGNLLSFGANNWKTTTEDDSQVCLIVNMGPIETETTSGKFMGFSQTPTTGKGILPWRDMDAYDNEKKLQDVAKIRGMSSTEPFRTMGRRLMDTATGAFFYKYQQRFDSAVAGDRPLSRYVRRHGAFFALVGCEPVTTGSESVKAMKWKKLSNAPTGMTKESLLAALPDIGAKVRMMLDIHDEESYFAESGLGPSLAEDVNNHVDIWTWPVITSFTLSIFSTVIIGAAAIGYSFSFSGLGAGGAMRENFM